jgi:hypothetical protein
MADKGIVNMTSDTNHIVNEGVSASAPSIPRRSGRWWVVVLLVGLCLAILSGDLALAGLNPPSPQTPSDLASWLILFAAFAGIGALLVAYRPGNPVGWLYYTAGMAGALSGFGGDYARYALLTNPGSLPFGYVFGLLSNVAFYWALVPMFTFLPLLFPTGHSPSPRWRWAGWLTVAGSISVTASSSLTPTIALGQDQWGYIIENPIGIPGAEKALDGIFAGGLALVLVSAFFSAISVFFRYRRAGRQERAQIRWFVYAVAINVGYLFLSEIARLDLPEVLIVLVLITLPFATAFAIFKYRLFDIDVIIRRTLVYGALTLTLALIYFGSIVVLQNVFVAVSGQRSPVAVVISTLAIAALFTPLRRRIQNDIDRRFFRRKYDAQKTLEAFSANLRGELDLEDLSDRLLAVVADTLEPAHASLWLRERKK